MLHCSGCGGGARGSARWVSGSGGGAGGFVGGAHVTSSQSVTPRDYGFFFPIMGLLGQLDMSLSLVTTAPVCAAAPYAAPRATIPASLTTSTPPPANNVQLFLAFTRLLPTRCCMSSAITPPHQPF